MIEVIAKIKGISPMGQSRAIQSKRDTGEGPDDHEERTWKERLHTDENGVAVIPPMAIKNCLADCAKYLSESVPGKGKSTYTKHFEAGILCLEPASLGIKAKDVQGTKLHVPSDGIKGGAKRVYRYFPTIPTGWEAECHITVMDPILISKPEKIHEYFVHAGKFIGLGCFRPRRGGFWGRFTVESFKTKNID